MRRSYVCEGFVGLGVGEVERGEFAVERRVVGAGPDEALHFGQAGGAALGAEAFHLGKPGAVFRVVERGEAPVGEHVVGFLVALGADELVGELLARGGVFGVEREADAEPVDGEYLSAGAAQAFVGLEEERAEAVLAQVARAEARELVYGLAKAAVLDELADELEAFVVLGRVGAQLAVEPVDGELGARAATSGADKAGEVARGGFVAALPLGGVAVAAGHRVEVLLGLEVAPVGEQQVDEFVARGVVAGVLAHFAREPVDGVFLRRGAGRDALRRLGLLEALPGLAAVRVEAEGLLEARDARIALALPHLEVAEPHVEVGVGRVVAQKAGRGGLALGGIARIGEGDEVALHDARVAGAGSEVVAVLVGGVAPASGAHELFGVAEAAAGVVGARGRERAGARRGGGAGEALPGAGEAGGGLGVAGLHAEHRLVVGGGLGPLAVALIRLRAEQQGLHVARVLADDRGEQLDRVGVAARLRGRLALAAGPAVGPGPAWRRTAAAARRGGGGEAWGARGGNGQSAGGQWSIVNDGTSGCGDLLRPIGH